MYAFCQIVFMEVLLTSRSIIISTGYFIFLELKSPYHGTVYLNSRVNFHQVLRARMEAFARKRLRAPTSNVFSLHLKDMCNPQNSLKLELPRSGRIIVYRLS